MTTVMRGVFAFCLAMALCAVGYGKETGFEGKWTLDKGQSTATADIPDALEQHIKMKGSEMVIESKWREPRNGIAPMVLLGVMTTDLKLNTAGTQSNMMIGPFQSVATTKVDGATAVTDWQSQVNGQSVTGHWTRTLSPDGRTMTLDIQQKSSDGKSATAKLVFKRK